MHSQARRGDAESPPQSALEFLRRSVGAVQAGGGSRRSQFEREVEALCLWSAEADRCLSSDFCKGLKPVASGAEHEVFFNEARQLAVKLTRDGRFGHSLEGEGLSALPSEYLQRLIYHNELFGDRISLRGVLRSEGAVHLVSFQPWIKLDAEHPVPDQGDVDDYFRNIGFIRSLHAAVPVYYHAELDLAVLDAHPQNILRDESGRLVPIDVVVGTPGKAVRGLLGIE